MVIAFSVPSVVRNVSDSELDVIRDLFRVMDKHFPGNSIKSKYYNMKVDVQPSANIPAEAMSKIEAVVDWPEKAVSALAERSIFSGFASPGDDVDPFGLSHILDLNRFDLELPQAITSSYKHSCAFVTTAVGDVESGEPEVVVLAREALWSAAIWDSRRRVISSFLAVTSVEDSFANGSGQIKSFDVYLPDVVLSVSKSGGVFAADRKPNPLGEVLVEPLPYGPQLDRPFGRSRISRAVRNITDHAMLAIVRAEISSDFYAAPRLYALNVSRDAFTQSKWQTAIDRFIAISADPVTGEKPEVGQFPQMTMQPLNDHYRTIATRFSGATGVPVSSLGIVTDNPPSAEALYADDRRIINMARSQNAIFGAALKRVGQRVVRLRDGGPVTPELSALDTSWVNPAFTSPSIAADALVKLASVFPEISESQDARAMAGFTQPEIERMMRDKRRLEAKGFADAVRSLGASGGVFGGSSGVPAAADGNIVGGSE